MAKKFFVKPTEKIERRNQARETSEGRKIAKVKRQKEEKDKDKTHTNQQKTHWNHKCSRERKDWLRELEIYLGITSLVVQWLRQCTPNARGPEFDP